MNLQKQVKKLLLFEAFWSFRPGSGLWVMFLGLRGFSLAQIGLAEGLFHLVSLWGELPSGLAADLLGRKRVLAASQGLFALSAAVMLLSRGMAGVLLSMGLSALGYNLASGTREALTYDSLLQMGREGEYLALSARQNMVYRGGDAAATLLAGLAVTLGWRLCYGLDVVLSIMAVGLAASLTEPAVSSQEEDTPRGLGAYLRATGRFLRRDPRAVGLMLFNALVGAVATLVGFYLQDALPASGTPAALLGPFLLLKGVGGMVGSRLAAPFGCWPKGLSRAFTVALVAMGCGLAFSGRYPLMALGAFWRGWGTTLWSFWRGRS